MGPALDSAAAAAWIFRGGDAAAPTFGRYRRAAKRNSERRRPFGLILAALDCGRRGHSNAIKASPNARRPRRYAVGFAAAVATVTELYEPFNLNDNLTIPFFSALALRLALHRIRCCGSCWG